MRNRPYAALHTHNPLGVKGCGESGAIVAPAALVSAVLDALGAKDIEMPVTAERVWAVLSARIIR